MIKKEFGYFAESPMQQLRSTASVSVVIPCYRCSASIARAVDSIASQTLLPLEVILVDDCSQDGTLSLLFALQALYGKSWLRVCELSSNGGPGSARNAGWKIAQGEYVAFLDSDDSWHPQKIELQYGWMRLNPNVVLTSHLVIMGDERRKKYRFDAVSPIRVSKSQLLMSNRFPTSTVMVRRDIKKRFVDGQRYCEDYRLWLHVIFFVGECCRFKQALTFNYKAVYGASGLSSRLWDMEKGELAGYWSLYRAGGINLLSLFFWTCLSLVKFLRRAFLVWL
ncbi:MULTISPECIES: glycosyltransferase family 2 protein [Pseudomonadaceae]|uniref:glycosyltransferase family 2 protein n=1 Tax=Pseudomonadaceae TaxID=135621 RepID=UPI0013F67E5C|nr:MULTISPECIES: glycosyltransferase [Pseudomonas]